MKRLAMILIVVTAACSTPAPVSMTEVGLAEFRVSPADEHLAAGPVAFEVVNSGEFSHTFVMTAADGSVVAATDPIGPDTTYTLTVGLAPGTYQVSCRIVVQLADGTIVDHYQEGMHALVHVTG